MKVLITGSAGFVGRHLVRHHLDAGDEVLGCDPANNGEHFNAAYSDCRALFIGDPMSLNVHNIDRVYHCAANVGGRVGINERRLWQAEDMAMDALFFDWIVRAQPRQAVYFSSSAVYSREWQRPFPDNISLYENLVNAATYNPTHADELYGYMKAIGEHRAMLLEQSGCTTDLFIVRPFSGYGTDQDLDYPFPSFVLRAIEHVDPFPVWGPLDSVRDWIHIDDIVLALQALCEDRALAYQPVNLCTGQKTAMGDLAQLCAEHTGYYPDIVSRPGPVGVHSRYGNPALMHTFYTPRISIDEGVARAIKEGLKK